MNPKGRGIFRIGTSGIVVPGGKESFPEAFRQKSRLNYYSSLFNTIEINSTFKKLPQPATFNKWVEDVPEHFKFTIKLWNEVTHVKQLVSHLDKINVFLEAARAVGHKKGCLLIQFPGKITIEYFNKVEEILFRIQEADSQNEWSKAVEFRNNSWYIRETFELLDYTSSSLVLHDMPKSANSRLNNGASFVYFRYHGVNGDYRGSYSEAFLKLQSETIKQRLDEGKDVYAYFNNTMGSAFDNAMSLRQMVEK
jgi:uncharacterized protein YecE (DUF72 family)